MGSVFRTPPHTGFSGFWKNQGSAELTLPSRRYLPFVLHFESKVAPKCARFGPWRDPRVYLLGPGIWLERYTDFLGLIAFFSLAYFRKDFKRLFSVYSSGCKEVLLFKLSFCNLPINTFPKSHLANTKGTLGPTLVKDSHLDL